MNFSIYGIYGAASDLINTEKTGQTHALCILIPRSTPFVWKDYFMSL